ncbi:aldo/keto reductase [Ramlibacter sp.]|uniref:aldo/keto reductase n=1 Tax=Ramlibacter sp. TaxID=1917967 RepID=UPI002D297D06|nr:aldo/keto reductase [Ramlibacter sp.]HYD76327.1 aldo/keto reductase [Ramlibacter sp.]
MNRRHLLQWLGGPALPALPVLAQTPAPLTKAIPSSGEQLPVVGLGTWITFNVGKDPQGRQQATEVMRAFFAAGGRLIDSSPMYGSAQPVVGDGLQKLGMPKALFAADKVWTSSDGAAQVEQSRQLWRVPRFDLLQVHNLLAWEQQLPMLQAMKQAGRVRYVGITTSEGRRHRDFEQVMRTHPLDFVQLTYNPVDREAEQRLLPLARERGIAVLANRPFRQGELVDRLARHPLPAFAAEIGCRSWAQLVLKHIVSHPAITCAIPATSRVDHVRENLAAASGPMPDAALRRRIESHIGQL